MLVFAFAQVGDESVAPVFRLFLILVDIRLVRALYLNLANALVANALLTDFVVLVPLQGGGVSNALFSDHEWLEYDAIGYIISQGQHPEIHQTLTDQLEHEHPANQRNYGHLRLLTDD